MCIRTSVLKRARLTCHGSKLVMSAQSFPLNGPLPSSQCSRLCKAWATAYTALYTLWGRHPHHVYHYHKYDFIIKGTVHPKHTQTGGEFCFLCSKQHQHVLLKNNVFISLELHSIKEVVPLNAVQSALRIMHIMSIQDSVFGGIQNSGACA